MMMIMMKMIKGNLLTYLLTYLLMFGLFCYPLDGSWMDGWWSLVGSKWRIFILNFKPNINNIFVVSFSVYVPTCIGSPICVFNTTATAAGVNFSAPIVLLQ